MGFVFLLSDALYEDYFYVLQVLCVRSLLHVWTAAPVAAANRLGSAPRPPFQILLHQISTLHLSYWRLHVGVGVWNSAQSLLLWPGANLTSCTCLDMSERMLSESGAVTTNG